MAGAGSHYFDERPGVASSPDAVDLALPDLHLRLTTDRGVFSHGRIDGGTKLLLLRVPTPPPAGDLLDLGCGVGPIALTMGRRAPAATVWAVDVNERARDLCAANATANAVANVRVGAPADVPADVRFSAIWSNPPIRIGKPALHELLTHWLGRLTPDGVAHLVVHKHLGADSLQRWLSDEAGHRTERIATSGGYRILRVAASV
jgi:16S rRNA (guanine1207-N2)-methyltransferase